MIEMADVAIAQKKSRSNERQLKTLFRELQPQLNPTIRLPKQPFNLSTHHQEQ
jgi:hypothetical protein